MSGTRPGIAPAHRSGLPLLAAALAGAVAAVAPLRDGMLIAGAAFVLTLTAVSPAYLAPIIALGVPFGSRLTLALGGFPAGPAEAGTALLGLGWLAAGFARRRLWLPPAWLWLPVGALLAAGVLSATQAASLSESAKELVKWLQFGIVLTVSGALLGERRPLYAAFAAMVLAGTLEALYGLNQAATGAGPAGFLLGGAALRAFGDFAQPNPFAAYLTLVLVPVGGVLLALLTSRRRLLATPPGMLLPAAAALMLAGIAASFSRSAWIALAAAGAVMLVSHDRRWAPGLAATVAGALLLGLLAGTGWLPASFTSRLAPLLENFSIFDPRDVTLTSVNFPLVQRMAIWYSAWAMFQDHLLFGVGIGNFNAAYPAYALPGWLMLPGHAHNYYLNLLAETGITGFGAYLVLLASLWGAALGALRRARTALGEAGAEPVVRYGLALGAVGLSTVLAVYQLFDNLYVHSMVAQAALVFGSAMAPVTGRHIGRITA